MDISDHHPCIPADLHFLFGTEYNRQQGRLTLWFPIAFRSIFAAVFKTTRYPSTYGREYIHLDKESIQKKSGDCAAWFALDFDDKINEEFENIKKNLTETIQMQLDRCLPYTENETLQKIAREAQEFMKGVKRMSRANLPGTLLKFNGFIYEIDKASIEFLIQAPHVFLSEETASMQSRYKSYLFTTFKNYSSRRRISFGKTQDRDSLDDLQGYYSDLIEQYSSTKPEVAAICKIMLTDIQSASEPETGMAFHFR